MHCLEMTRMCVSPWFRLQDLKSELKILLCLDHPHVVRLLDVYVSDDKLDIVMECSLVNSQKHFAFEANRSALGIVEVQNPSSQFCRASFMPPDIK